MIFIALPRKIIPLKPDRIGRLGGVLPTCSSTFMTCASVNAKCHVHMAFFVYTSLVSYKKKMSGVHTKMLAFDREFFYLTASFYYEELTRPENSGVFFSDVKQTKKEMVKDLTANVSFMLTNSKFQKKKKCFEQFKV